MKSYHLSEILVYCFPWNNFVVVGTSFLSMSLFNWSTDFTNPGNPSPSVNSSNNTLYRWEYPWVWFAIFISPFVWTRKLRVSSEIFVIRQMGDLKFLPSRCEATGAGKQLRTNMAPKAIKCMYCACPDIGKIVTSVKGWGCLAWKKFRAFSFSFFFPMSCEIRISKNVRYFSPRRLHTSG